MFILQNGLRKLFTVGECAAGAVGCLADRADVAAELQKVTTRKILPQDICGINFKI